MSERNYDLIDAESVYMYDRIKELGAALEREREDKEARGRAIDALVIERDAVQEAREDAERQLAFVKADWLSKMNCSTHPDVTPWNMWGCPDCLTELKREARVAEARLMELEDALCAYMADNVKKLAHLMGPNPLAGSE